MKSEGLKVDGKDSIANLNAKAGRIRHKDKAEQIVKAEKSAAKSPLPCSNGDLFSIRS